jgi:hypothetical protein
MTDGCFIYVWTFIDAQSYVGKARGIDRLAEYTNNLLKWLRGKLYRASDPDGWRAVHDRMYEGMRRICAAKRSGCASFPARLRAYWPTSVTGRRS